MRILLAALFVRCVAGCVVGPSDAELDADSELATMLADPTPEAAPVDADTSELAVARTSACTKLRYLHVADYSFVPLLQCVNGVCANGCWGGQRRANGFTCDYNAAQADFIHTTDGGGPFASYNEIKPLDLHDAAAVASCRLQSGRSIRAYTAWNGAGWDNEGIAAAVELAEIYGTQDDASSKLWIWYDGFRSRFSPLGNISPETRLSAAGVTDLVARLCSATRTGWLGVYFYDATAAGGAGMADWKAQAIIEGMNYCTTH